MPDEAVLVHSNILQEHLFSFSPIFLCRDENYPRNLDLWCCVDPQQDHQFRWTSLIQSAECKCCLLWACHELSLSGSACLQHFLPGNPGPWDCCGLWVAVFYCETSAALVSVAKPALCTLPPSLTLLTAWVLAEGSCISWLFSLLCHSAELCEQPPTCWEEQ